MSLPIECLKFWEGNEKGTQRYIVCAANRFLVKGTNDEIIIASSRHYSSLMSSNINLIKSLGLEVNQAYGDNQGFIDQFDDYHTREEALVIATHANQIKNKSWPSHQLFSEDLY